MHPGRPQDHATIILGYSRTIRKTRTIPGSSRSSGALRGISGLRRFVRHAGVGGPDSVSPVLKEGERIALMKIAPASTFKVPAFTTVAEGRATGYLGKGAEALAGSSSKKSLLEHPLMRARTNPSPGPAVHLPGPSTSAGAWCEQVALFSSDTCILSTTMPRGWYLPASSLRRAISSRCRSRSISGLITLPMFPPVCSERAPSGRRRSTVIRMHPPGVP